jgi:beta-galactosidase
MMKFSLLALVVMTGLFASGQRVSVALDGEWQVEDSVSSDTIPTRWAHTVSVPGLANLSQPAFADVDRFDSKEVVSNRVRQGKLPESTLIEGTAGIPRQARNYFWYRRTFRVPTRQQVALLRINKAQFGTAVWLNGTKLGEYAGCFTASYFDLTEAMNWSGDNQLIIRIGAHPAVLPESFPTGSDFEKNRWTPGIYDSVSVLLMDNPVIETIQVAPKISPPQIVIQTKLRNYGPKSASVSLRHRVKTWKGGKQVAVGAPHQVAIGPHQEKTVTQTISVPNATLWSPENPFLYVLDSSSGGDSVSTRFGIREFHFDTATKRAYLNGKPYFLRGSNITLHRFFEDPSAGSLTWDEKWVRKLLVEIPKSMNWNMFRFCIGPVPDKWLEIADEAGLLIQYEFFIWTGHPSWRGKYSRTWNSDELVRQYKDWMRDNWNHASVVVWDANNESYDSVFHDKVIPAVRALDLSNRPWENSYNLPAGPDDPVEDHPYLYIKNWDNDGEKFDIAELEGMSGTGGALSTPSAHPVLLNEYGWLWLNRDGTPTVLTPKVYEALLGKDATPEERLALWAYLLAGKTEFWRANRNHAGVLHFVYLTSCYQGAYTCDNFQDVKSLTLEPHFADYVREAFKPLGVYLNFWQPKLKAGENRRFTVMMVNDAEKLAAGVLVLTLETRNGEIIARSEEKFSIPALGAETYLLDLQIPTREGDFLLKATAHGKPEPTVSRRKVSVAVE